MKRLLPFFAALALIVPLFMGAPVKTMQVKTDTLISLPILETASQNGMAPIYSNEHLFLSPEYEAEFPFQLLGLNWQEELPPASEVNLEIRFRSQKGVWTEWEELEQDQDGAETEGELQTYVITDNSEAFQYRAFLKTEDTSVTPKLSNVNFDYINGGKTPVVTKLARLTFDTDPTFVTRKEWGANEDLRLARNYPEPEPVAEDDHEEPAGPTLEQTDPDMKIVKTVSTDPQGNDLYWELEYPKEIKKIIVHHTATTSDLNNPEAAIRAIYHYHALTRDWGDIGYNYIIAPNGKIYEGRFGGDGVIAGHASGYNTGSVGISLLGHYDQTPVPAPVLESLTGLIYEKAQLHGIDPDSSGLFRGRVIPNILGHRDVASTACPGGMAYDFLPEIRQTVGDALDTRRHTNSRADFSFEEVEDRELIHLAPNESETITIKIKNTGTSTWTSSTYLKVTPSASSDPMVNFAKESSNKIATMKESSVKPGATASFTFTVTGSYMGGLALFDLSPVFNGGETTRKVIDFAALVDQPTLKFTVVSTGLPSSLLKPGESSNVSVKLKNTGNLTWKNSGSNAVSLRKSGDSVLNSNRTLASLKESEVKPGATGTFEFTVKAPTGVGRYALYFVPEMANSNATLSSAGSLSVEVSGSSEDATLTNPNTDLSFEPGQNRALNLTIQNGSKSTWKKTGVGALEIQLSKPSSVIVTTPKLSVTSLLPGRSARINFSVTAPQTPGTYTLEFRPRLNGKNLTNSAFKLTITVEEDEETGDTGTTSSTLPTYEDAIRIKLTPDNTTDPILTSSQSFTLYDNDKLIKKFSASSRVRTTKSGTAFKVTSGESAWTLNGPLRFVPTSGGVIQVLTMDQRPAWNLTLNDNEFRGTMEVRQISGATTLINELALEDYLKGIGEVSNGDPKEKVKTIITLARSYATYYMTVDEKFPGQPYDLDDDPNVSQKYLGYGYEKRSPNTAAAVSETAGMVVTYGGKVVKTPYFSKSDGVATKNAKDVWGWTTTPWLVSVSDSLCSSTGFEGHGVGLSGCGATEMAKQGDSYIDIINYYYNGIEVKAL